MEKNMNILPDINKYILIYEGKYLNEKSSGKGEEYKYGKLIFERKYLNGKRYGTWIEYELNGYSKFEGNYAYGIKMEKERICNLW